MKKVTAGPLRWLFKSAPGVALLVIAAGVGVGYAANNGSDGKDKPKRSSLEAFGQCMQENAPEPPEGDTPTDPAKGEDAMDAAFDTCKTKLTDEQRTMLEAHQAQEEKFRTCMEENGAPKPPAPPAPPAPPTSKKGKDAGAPPAGARFEFHAAPLSKADEEALKKADEACADLHPEGLEGNVMIGPGPGGPHGPGGPGGMPGPPPGPPRG